MIAWLMVATCRAGEEAAPETPPVAPEPAAPVAPEAPPIVPAQGVVIFPMRAINLPIEEVQAADALFRAAFARAAGRAVEDAANTRRAVQGGTDADYVAACAALACSEWVALDLIRLDREIFVTGRVFDGAGAMLWRVDVVAESVAELQGAFDRLAASLEDRIPYERTSPSRAYVAASSGGELPLPSRVPSQPGLERLHGVRAGVWAPLNDDYGPAVAIAYSGRWERKDNFTEFEAGFAWPTDVFRPFFALFTEYGYSRLWPVARFAWYAGGGGGPRIGGYDDIGVGFGFYGHIGLTTVRDASSRGYVHLRIGLDALTSADTGSAYGETHFALETGIGF